nr:MAG TPA: hypothetical protein [Caudoviricetes sp.]
MSVMSIVTRQPMSFGLGKFIATTGVSVITRECLLKHMPKKTKSKYVTASDFVINNTVGNIDKAFGTNVSPYARNIVLNV